MFLIWLHFACNLSQIGRLHVCTLVCFGPWTRHLACRSSALKMFRPFGMALGRLCIKNLLFLGEAQGKILVDRAESIVSVFSLTSVANCILFIMYFRSTFRWGRSQPCSRSALLESQGELDRARINGRWIMNFIVSYLFVCLYLPCSVAYRIVNVHLYSKWYKSTALTS
jgi:hypothetical protein